MREIQDTRTSISNLSTDVSGRLAMASSHHIGLHRLPPVLRGFNQRYPQVIVDISFLDSEEAYQQVIHGEIELAVVTLSLEAIDRIERRVLWPDSLSFMTARDHPLANRGEVGLKQLLDYPSILPSENTFTRQLVEKIFSGRKLKLEVEMSTNYLETIKMMVSIGMAWSVLPDTMLDDSLCALPVSNAGLNRELGYITHRDHTLTNAAAAFIETLERNKVLN
jgi:DNA-binding transcriptional LysR family regulator